MITFQEFKKLDKNAAISIRSIGYKLLTKPFLAVNASVRKGEPTYHAVVESLDIAAYGPAKTMHIFALEDRQNSYALFYRICDKSIDSVYPKINPTPLITTNGLELIK